MKYLNTSIISQSLAVCATIALSVGITSCSSGDEPLDNGTKGTYTITGKMSNGNISVRAIAGTDYNMIPSVRTSFEGTFPNSDANSVVFYWEAGDKIYSDGQNVSVNSVTSKATDFTFTFNSIRPEGSTSTADPVIYYVGTKSETYNEVTIATSQAQTTPNDTKHIAQYGDCGTATAKYTGINSDGTYTYNFTLEHKAAYICFLPHMKTTEYTLSKIKVATDGTTNIAGKYTLSADGLTEESEQSTSITLTTSDFPIGTEYDQSANASYMVIAPGTHTLTITYTVKNINSLEEYDIVETYLTQQFAANTVYTVSNPLTRYTISTDKYYLWDAVSAVDMSSVTAFPTEGSDTWYNTTSTKNATATNTLSGYANYTTMLQFVTQGDLHWDSNTYWEIPGRGVFKGGIWIKKRALWSSYEYDTSKTSVVPAKGNPTKTTVNSEGITTELHYSFVPALGSYTSGTTPTGMGTYGYYWSSTNYDATQAYSMRFDSTTFVVELADKNKGYRRINAKLI